MHSPPSVSITALLIALPLVVAGVLSTGCVRTSVASGDAVSSPLDKPPALGKMSVTSERKNGRKRSDASAPKPSTDIQVWADCEANVGRERGEGRGGYAIPQCTGKAQSPINIRSSVVKSGSHSVLLRYQTSKERVLNLGHTVEVEFEEGGSLVFDGQAFDLVQFHFHTPSEHRVDGVMFPMEMHIVHRSPVDPNRFLVVGVLFKEGMDNPLIESLLNLVPRDVGAGVDAETAALNVQSVFKESDHYYHYEGSLTTPPFTETVTWLVLTQPREASPGQITEVNRIEGDNARHIQHARERRVDTD